MAAIAPFRAGLRRIAGELTLTVVVLVVVVVLSQWSAIRSGYASPDLWIMTMLAAFAGTQAFISTTPPSGVTPVILGSTVCFTFAILLTWGLGPAVVAQVLALAVVGVRLRRPFVEMLAAFGGYMLSFVAAEAVLRLGNPDLNHHDDPIGVLTDTLTIVGAAGAWLLTYGLLTVLLARLTHPGPRTMSARDIVSHHVLFRAALLLLSPLLAIAIDLNIGLVVLIFVPLYAVQRMAKLSAQRDRGSRQDLLTGLANRAGLKAGFDHILAGYSHNSNGSRATVIIADLDEFKAVNDALGHEVGDQLLIAVAGRLAGIPLSSGTVARLGGDEFALMTLARGPAGAKDIADIVVEALSEPVSLDGLRIDITASIGTALHSDDEDFAALMRHADIAMYDAKNSG